MTEVEVEIEDEVPAGEDDAAIRRKRLTDAEAASAKELYELGKFNNMELAEKFGVHRSTMSRKLRDLGAQKGIRAGEVAAAVKAEVQGYSAQRAAWAEETRVNGYNFLKNLRMIMQKMFMDRVKTGSMNFEMDDVNFRALGRLNKMALDNISGSLQLLDADNLMIEDDLPILQLEDLTQNDILEHFKSTGVLPEDATIEDLNTENIR